MKTLPILLFSLSLFPLTAVAQRPLDLGGSSGVTEKSEYSPLRRTALHKGDKLTIVISETMQGQYAASTTTSKTSASSTDASNIPLVGALSKSAFGSILGGKTAQSAINALLGANSTGGKEAIAGSGTTTSTNSLTGTMSVVVTEVEPNGDLHIEGHRDIRLNKETQTMVLTGVVRPDDISADNTITSAQVANASIQADGKGAIADKTRRGILSRVLGWIF